MYRLLLLPQSPGGLSIVRSSGRSWPLPRDWQVTCLWLPSRYHFTYPLPGPLGVRLPGLTVPGRMHSVSCRLWGAHVSPVTREEGSQVLAWGSQAALIGLTLTVSFLPRMHILKSPRLWEGGSAPWTLAGGGGRGQHSSLLGSLCCWPI